jgi:hypothetical protein
MGLNNYPTSQDTDNTLEILVNNWSTTLSASCTDTDTTIHLTTVVNLPNEGVLSFTDNAEIIHYTGKSGNDITGCTRGYDSSTATAHSSGCGIEMRYIARLHNYIKDTIIAIEVKLDTREAVANKGIASGYASLDASTLVPLAQIPTTLTGKDADTVDTSHASAFVTHALVTAVNDFLIASGNGVVVKKTLAETLTILGKAIASGLASLDASSLVVQEPASKAQASGLASLNASSLVIQNPATAYLPLAGGTMVGILYAQANTSYTTGQARNIFLSTGDASGGGNGDVWIKYTA